MSSRKYTVEENRPHQGQPRHRYRLSSRSEMALGELSIVQFNCGKSNHGAMRPIFDAMSPDTHCILAIQEPGFSKRTGTTYCPRGYKLVYDPNQESKVCFMIGDRIHA